MTRTRRLVALACLALLVVGAGCQGVDWPDDDGPPPTGVERPDPDTDVVGWEDGYWHNESIDVNQSDGLSDEEMRAYVGRAMARVEVIRDREFERKVPVEVISREAYRERSRSGTTPDAYRAWNNQVWEAMFVVGEDADVQEQLTSTLGSAVLGFYSPSEDHIKIITPTPDSPTIDNGTLVHELVHALQDQYHDLGSGTYAAPTQDGDLAIDGLVEGEAAYVERQYLQRCGDSWSCVNSPPSDGGGGGGPPPNYGLSITLYFPYSDGPVYVADLVEEGGWAAVNEAFADPPTSSEQIIHVTDEEPVEVTVADAARNGWERFDGQGSGGADTLGEASIFAMFWYQSRTYDAGVVDWRDIGSVNSPLDVYDYESEPSAGWAGDAVVPYRNGDRRGYVWKTKWDTVEDAREFRTAYLDVLAAHDATQVDERTWVVEDGPFEDAFRVVRENATVVVTNAPTADALDDVRPADGDAGTVEPTTAADGAGVPGFGVGVALVAALAAAAAGLARRRRR